MNAPLCINCLYWQAPNPPSLSVGEYSICTRTARISAVDGKTEIIDLAHKFCAVEREQTKLATYCGPDGRFYEAAFRQQAPL